ncbi:hypothetical protein BAZSYMA_ACONTIG126469_0 [Bathymodiolus azoricus thioautotrophic gill symbiont]|uniref:Uncharacterized protein n=1 Tax=Bathymodiolus azoricus thioautotrophic gill symbiont TaxID=235205 RepID=A0A1H6MFR6_9GAMM|nr:hypothetical protein BAZSYMA_ACONTIG126469_0 [Bathymodiolus azoricus thioautotrophic gill symbiont]
MKIILVGCKMLSLKIGLVCRKFLNLMSNYLIITNNVLT